jgi:hypothetical protein
VVEVGRGAAAAGRARRLPAGWPAPVAWTAGALALLLVGWPALRWAGGRLRERHRFAAHVCQVDGRASVCLWRPMGSGDSPVRGVWDGFGLQLDRLDGRGQLAATTVLSLPAGRWRVRILVDLAPAPRGVGSALAGTVGLRAQGSPGANATLAEVAAASAAGATTPLETTVATAGQPLALELTVAAPDPTGPGVALWASAVSVARAD